MDLNQSQMTAMAAKALNTYYGGKDNLGLGNGFNHLNNSNNLSGIGNNMSNGLNNGRNRHT